MSESLFREAMLLRQRCELEAAVARFQAIKMHMERAAAGLHAHKYSMADLDHAADVIAGCGPDPHNYA